MYSGQRKLTIGDFFGWRDVEPEKMSVAPITEGSGSGKPLNVNRYATKKTLAQGMLDIALLTANASQLKYVITMGADHQFYSLMLGLIITSLILQILVGVLFLVLGGLDINRSSHELPADILNNVVIVFIFLISIVNVIINAFGIEHTNRIPPGSSFERSSVPK